MNYIYKIYEMMYFTFIAQNRISKLENKKGRKLYIVANGPSASKYIDEIDLDDENTDVLCMNQFIFKEPEKFMKIKPKYYIAMDGGFWSVSEESPTVHGEFIESIEKVDWDMQLICNPHITYKLKNPNIHMQYLSPVQICSDSKLVQMLYKHNLCIPSLSNVSTAAVFWGIVSKYKEIKVMGLDYSNFLLIHVDVDNTIYMGFEHCYEKAKHSNVSKYYFSKMGDLWRGYEATFNSFYVLRKLADNMGTKVINMNPNSLLDAFPKK